MKRKFTNYVLRIPVTQEVGKDIDFALYNKTVTIEELRKHVKNCLKDVLGIKNIKTSELDEFILDWGVWDELTVKIRKGDEVFESILGLHIDRHLQIMHSYATILATKKTEDLNDLVENPLEGLIIIDEKTRLGSFKARCDVSDIIAG